MVFPLMIINAGEARSLWLDRGGDMRCSRGLARSAASSPRHSWTPVVWQGLNGGAMLPWEIPM